jgi:TolB-like protein
MFRRIVLTLALILLACAPALAEQVKTFAVLPFQVHGPKEYKYLEQGIQSMLVSRMTWPEHFESVNQDELAGIAAPATRDAALATLKTLGADYLVYGSTTIMGDQASLDVQVLDAQGNAMPQSSQTTLSGLIPSLEATATAINGEVFKRPEEKKAAAPAKKQVNRMNPGLIFNESDTSKEFVLNPEFRYQGDATGQGRWRSQTLPFISRGMVVTDADSDGQNEVFILEEHGVKAYRVQQNRLVPAGSYETTFRISCLNLNAIDQNKDGYKEIIVSALEGEKDIRSFILEYRDGNLVEKMDRIPYFMSVVNVPPLFRPTLVGQKAGHALLLESTVHEMILVGGEYQLGTKLPLPDKANVFNIVYLPQEDDYKLIIADEKDHLQVFNSANTFQAATDEQYAGSSVGVPYKDVLPGMAARHDDDLEMFTYLPSRLVPANLDDKGGYELLVNRNISVASQYFVNYRKFPQGEMHYLAWDGLGLSLVWKTRRIKGTVVDYAIADPDNNGTKDLVVCVNTHPGATGLRNIKTMLLAYPLDLEGQQN